jgi:hypothetical protein
MTRETGCTDMSSLIFHFEVLSLLEVKIVLI